MRGERRTGARRATRYGLPNPPIYVISNFSGKSDVLGLMIASFGFSSRKLYPKDQKKFKNQNNSAINVRMA